MSSSSSSTTSYRTAAEVFIPELQRSVRAAIAGNTLYSILTLYPLPPPLQHHLPRHDVHRAAPFGRRLRWRQLGQLEPRGSGWPDRARLPQHARVDAPGGALVPPSSGPLVRRSALCVPPVHHFCLGALWNRADEDLTSHSDPSLDADAGPPRLGRVHRRLRGLRQPRGRECSPFPLTSRLAFRLSCLSVAGTDHRGLASRPSASPGGLSPGRHQGDCEHSLASEIWSAK